MYKTIQKGVVLCGGSGKRLGELTKILNKHLLPIHDKPMCYYPIATLINAGIKDIMIVTGKGHARAFIDLLGDGSRFNAKFTYRVQEGAGGIAEALGLCEDFVCGSNVAVILGDNIFSGELEQRLGIREGAKIFLKEVHNPERFGVANFNGAGEIIDIVEKPNNPKNNLIVTGLYIYDNKIWDVIKTLYRSERGELEITDINNWYIGQGLMNYEIIKDEWIDAGTPDSLLRASNFIKKFKINNYEKNEKN